jgi:thymidylate synthase
MKVVIRSPLEGIETLAEHIEVLQDKLDSYKETLLDPSLGEQTYSYGNRVRAYFDCDLLDCVIKDLGRSEDARRSYITLWDNRTDAPAKDAPCLVSLFFRKTENQVSLTATFRSHNAVEAWPQNCLALARAMEFVCEKVNNLPGKEEFRKLGPGVLTVFSQSISINPKEFPKVKERVEEYAQRHPPIEMDPYGYLRLSIDPVQKELIAQLFDHGNEFLEEFRGSNPDELARVLCQKEAVSDLNHAMYIGRQLERACFCLHNGREYIQDKTVIKI